MPDSASTPAVTLSEAGKAKLNALLADQVVNADLPAIFNGITTADGDIYFNCAGRKNQGDESEGSVDENTTLQLWSMTKLMTSIACLQLAEKGLVSIDDPATIEKHLPELWAQPILTGFTEDDKPITAPRTRPITLRNLLTHTAGMSYMFSAPEIAKWEKVTNAPSWLAKNAGVDALVQPLMFEPGTQYKYGINIDWAGVLVWRVSGKKLGEYFQDHIFGPSGVSADDLSFYPTDSIKARLMTTCARGPEGQLVPTPGMRDIKAMNPEDIGVHLGGAGLLGTAKAHMRVLRQILLAKDGRSDVISKYVFDALFAPALPLRDGSNTAHKQLGQMVAMEGLKEPHFISGDKISHSLGQCLLEADSSAGPKAGTGFWGGAARTRFWIDPATGIAGWYGTQLLDMGQPAIFSKAYFAYQRAVYDALAL